MSTCSWAARSRSGTQGSTFVIRLAGRPRTVRCQLAHVLPACSSGPDARIWPHRDAARIARGGRFHLHRDSCAALPGHRWFAGWHFSLESGNGLAAIYQYIKEVWLAGCLALAFLQTRATVFVGWTLLFAFLLLDDALELHERFGAIVAVAWNLPAIFGLRPADLGEIRGRRDRLRRPCAGDDRLSPRWPRCASAIGGFDVPARGAGALWVFFDMLHTITYFHAPSVAQVFSLIEDGGEMLVVSAITAYVFDLASNAGRPRLGVWVRVRAAVPRG